MSSVLDIAYRRPEQWEAAVNGSMLGGGVYLGWGNKQFSVMTSARYKTTRYLLGTLDTGGEYRPNFFDYQLVSRGDRLSSGRLMCWEMLADNHYNLFLT